MTKQEFRELCGKQVVFLDGATGSNLFQRGMPAGVCPEKWILENREVMLQLQREYVDAGSNILYAPTFTSNRVKLTEYGLGDRIQEINQKLVSISREAADGKAFVAGDLTMTGEQLAPMGKMGLEELIAIYKEQIICLVEAGVDLLVVETMMSLQETRAALIAAKETCDLPVMVTMTFEADGRALYGTDAKSAAIVLESLGADAIGANCSTGPGQMAAVIREIVSACALPVIAKPNAGLPASDEQGRTVYDMDADTFAGEMAALAEAGASILGGCCGTSPLFIKKLREKTENFRVTVREPDARRMLASERQSLEFGLEDSFLIVGERINPTGKKKLQAELLAGCFQMVRQFAEEQEACGAGILDINMGMSGIDEKEMMLKTIEEVGLVTALPLAIDSSHVEVIEQALRHYPGRALINSISLEKTKFDNLLPLAKKYGAMFILLPLSDEGLPKDLAEKKKIIEIITDKALTLGMRKEDIVVDGLVTTVGANKKAALETLETIGFCKEKGLATICGLSNISFGLPERSYVNTVFLTMAIQAGLTMAIANPSQQLLVNSAFAADLLLNKEGADIRYIETVNRSNGQEAESQNRAAGNKAEPSILEKLKEAVLKGNQKAITGLTKEAVETGNKAQSVLNQVLLPAINLVGDYFDSGKYFLPQLIASAEAMKLSIEYLEPLLTEDGGSQDMPVIVIATVEGDIHDIGKNLVALMLKNHGFHVIDLGKDVSKETIVRAAVENHAQVIALSALMTTTMQEMRHVITYAREQGVDAKVIIGGAVITQEYADEIGADGYSRDAADAVRLTKRILQLKE